MIQIHRYCLLKYEVLYNHIKNFINIIVHWKSALFKKSNNSTLSNADPSFALTRPRTVFHTRLLRVRSALQYTENELGTLLAGNLPNWKKPVQCSQNVDVNGPHHRCFELIVSSSFNQPMAVERGRSHELVGSMVGAVYVHVLRTLPIPYNHNLRGTKTHVELIRDVGKIVHQWNSKFNGSSKASAEDFLTRVDECRIFSPLSDMKLISAPSLLLTGVALQWYRLKKAQWTSWSTFKMAFRSRFVDDNFDSRVRD